MAVFIVAVVAWQKGRVTVRSLAPVLLAAFTMEALDLRDDYQSFGYLRWSASVHDIVNTTFWPIMIVGLVRLGVVK